MMSSENTQSDWSETAYGSSFFELERVFTDRAVRQISGPCVLQVGNLFNEQRLLAQDFPQMIKICPADDPGTASSGASLNCTMVYADAAFLPFDANSFSSVVLPHVLEGHCLPHQVLREVHRVLRPEGLLMLTGFSPLSLLSIQRYLFPRAALKGNYYTVKRVKDWMKLLGFEVTGSAMYQYAPLCKNTRLRNALGFINSVGNRWLPMTGGGYMIQARKREVGMNLIGRHELSAGERRPRKLATTVSANARSSIESNSHWHQ